jgi:uncharacterized protein (TIGR01244 family)
MFKTLLPLLAALALALPAVAEDTTAMPGASIYADLDKVREQGIVTPVDGISSTGQPDEAALQVFADSGYVAVIDLRTDKEKRGIEEVAVVEGLGMQYVNVPVAGVKGVNFESARALQQVLADFDEPVLVHCGSGNRVGALLALGQVLEGADHESAIEHGKTAGMTVLEKRVREVLEVN